MKPSLKRQRTSAIKFLEKFKRELVKHKGQFHIIRYCDLQNKALDAIVEMQIEKEKDKPHG